MNRRSFLQTTALAASSLSSACAQQTAPRKKLAALVGNYRIRSDADKLVTRLLEGYWINDDYHRPQCDIASLYIHKSSAADVGARVASAYGIALADSIPSALKSVDGVLLIGDQNLSASQMFKQAVAVRPLPTFCLGQLAETWDLAKRMYDQSKDLGFPLLSGASQAVTFRRPELDYPLPSGFDDAPLGDTAKHTYPLGIEFEDALVIGPKPDFAALEVLQSFMERRRGGETGIASVECLSDAAVWRSAAEGRWSKELMQAALERAERLGKSSPETAAHPMVCLINYRDGSRAALLSLGEFVDETVAAFRVKGRREIDCTLCFTPIESRNDFSMLAHGVTQLMITGQPPYPPQRGLLVSGALASLRESMTQAKPIDTPMLDVNYTGPEHSFYAKGRGW